MPDDASSQFGSCAVSAPISGARRRLTAATVPPSPTLATPPPIVLDASGRRRYIAFMPAPKKKPSDTFADPQGLLTGESKGGRHLKLTKLDQLPRAQVLGWLRTAARIAKQA